MVKKFSMLALAGLIALPALASASAGPSSSDGLDRKIDELSRELDRLKAQLAEQGDLSDLQETVESLDARSESWDLAARFKFYGDFRSRYDYLNAGSAPAYRANDVARGMSMAMGQQMGAGPYSLQQVQMAMQGMMQQSAMAAQQMGVSPGAARAMMFQQMGITPSGVINYNNDSSFTNRFRLNMRVKATEAVEFKGRLAMYKSWGMQSNPNAPMGSAYTMDAFAWDGNSTRQPIDNALLVDRAFLNWNGIGGAPIWFSIGRRPTTDGPPAHIRLGANSRMATPIHVMDYAFDGISIGYAYRWGADMGTGRVRFCYGRGFESGMSTTMLDDMDFGGLSWDVIKKGSRFVNVQSFMAANLVNTPDGVTFQNPLEANGIMAGDGYLDRANLGDILHTSLVYTDKFGPVNIYGTGAWSRTMADGYDEAGNTLLGSWWQDGEEEKDGYMVLVGARFDLDNVGLKFGAEFNWGSENWVSMSPAHDDLYNSKLATRGWASEVYMIWDLPTGEAISKYAQTFMRLGWQHYDYAYTGSGSWLGAPVDIDELASDPFNAQFYPAITTQEQVYLTFEAYF
ncbi:MAG: DUF3373 family protein [Thermodesulfobacteriota bacterium]